ncbi:hypothetical protein [Streptomyces sp. NPDC007088]|uniref:hypothetical protein n=1 Tax=Streptomyces sp. NPDC007088 TaxID=3364773 RepID=UPI0036B40204
MRVRVLAVSAALLVAASASACSSTTEDPAPPSSHRPAASASPAADGRSGGKADRPDGKRSAAMTIEQERAEACDLAVAEGRDRAPECIAEGADIPPGQISEGTPVVRDPETPGPAAGDPSSVGAPALG